MAEYRPTDREKAFTIVNKAIRKAYPDEGEAAVANPLDFVIQGFLEAVLLLEKGADELYAASNDLEEKGFPTLAAALDELGDLYDYLAREFEQIMLTLKDVQDGEESEETVEYAFEAYDLLHCCHVFSVPQEEE